MRCRRIPLGWLPVLAVLAAPPAQASAPPKAAPAPRAAPTPRAAAETVPDPAAAAAGKPAAIDPVPAAAAAGTPAAAAAAGAAKIDPRERHFADLLQLTHGGQNAEAYWSPDGRQLIFQSTRPPFACDQIFRMPADGSAPPALVSTGKGRTTCSYFMPGGERVLYSSTHAAGDACPPAADRSHGYVWAVYGSYEIYTARPDGGDLRRLTSNSAYDAETTVCPRDGSLLFTSDRDGDLELYRMKADGSDVRRLTHTPGYDGGGFFSPDCSRIVWRASRPQGAELEEYKRLLAGGLVRPTKLEIWTANADGSEARQLTYLDAASFAPSFFPSGRRIIFSSNYGDPKGREFELWAVNLDGTGLERITWSPGFDGFPMFSPDGRYLAFSSNRGQGKPGETDVFVARWSDAGSGLSGAGAAVPSGAGAAAAPGPGAAAAPGPGAAQGSDGPGDAHRPGLPDAFMADVRWLADDARQGRGVGTAGLEESRQWLARRFAEAGLEPAGDAGGWFQGFDVPVAIEVEPGTAVTLDGQQLARADFQPAGFSASGSVTAPVIMARYGIEAPELGMDDYRGVDAAGKIVVVRRFTPPGAAFTGDAERRYGDLRYKAHLAREHGARALIVVDVPATPAGGPPAGAKKEAAGPPAGAQKDTAAPAAGAPKEAAAPAEAPLPAPEVDAAAGGGDAGLPVVLVKRAAAERLLAPGEHRGSIQVHLTRRTRPAANVVGRLRAGASEPLAGAVLVGAHYDHLGLGGHGSLDPESHLPHHGADDNASGTAALLAAAELLRSRAAGGARLRRDVYFVAFSGEESGVLGSTAFTRHPPGKLAMGDLVAMLNMDMVGRLRDNQLAVLGGESAPEWRDLVPPACARELLACTLGGDGYGPSDHSPFYAAGVPVLHFFTGAHEDYHKPSDTAEKINAAGGAQVARLVADVAHQVADRPDRLTYKSAAAPAPQGDARSYGASLGTIPDYAGDGRPGVLIGGVRPGGAAEQAGLRRGDLLTELAGTPVRDIYDFMYILQRFKPGDKAKAVVDRAGQRLEVEVTFTTARPR
jgi:Tol biopolymer transport system component/Zn-dependent M28 family amino/carboxypeptidase